MKSLCINSKTTVLNEKAKQLNSQYNDLGQHFTLENSVIKIFNFTNYLLIKFPEIKELLVRCLNAKFNNKIRWYIRNFGIR